MNKFDELVNDYTLTGDDGAVIFSGYDRFLEFVEKIRADEREWVGLTDEEVKYLVSHFDWRAPAEHFVSAIESKLKEKNQ